MISSTQLFASIVGMVLLAGAIPDTVAQTSPNDRLGLFPISAALCNDMKSHNVLHGGAPVGCDRLKLIRFEHVGFDGLLHRGEIVVMDAAADHVRRVFGLLVEMKFPIEKAKLMNYYNGSDDEAIADNNTSGFNHRSVEGGNALSLHAYGLAIDLNPKQNPYVKRNRSGIVLSVSPPSSIDHVSRPRSRANPRLGMAESVVDLFAEHGFSVWGGYWPYEVDYQHFAVSRSLALHLARLSPVNAQALFEENVRSYVTCRGEGRSRSFCVNRE
jgi:D-alanyl-D-alanine carboxypeptidase-like protein